MRSTLSALAILVLLASAAVAADATTEARNAIEQANARFTKEFEQRNAAAIAAMYTEDAIVFPPGQEIVKGRQAIEQFWKSTMNAGVKSAVLTTLEVTISGDLAVGARVGCSGAVGNTGRGLGGGRASSSGRDRGTCGIG